MRQSGNLEKYSFENDLAGMFLSGNPMSEYLIQSAMLTDTRVYSINDGEIPDGEKVSVCGIASKVNASKTKSGVFICTMSFADFFASCEVTCFESVYSRYSNLLNEGSALLITAQVRKRDDRISLSLISAQRLDNIKPSEDARLYIKLSGRQEVSKISDVISKHRGSTTVYLYFEDTGTSLVSDSTNGVTLTNELIQNLIENFGSDNIKIR